MSLGGQVWIVTGASRGIGAEVAREVAARGGRPVLAARRQAALDQVAASIEEEHPGARALAIATDVTDEAQVASLVERAVAEAGGVDVLVANAGQTMHAFFEDTDPEVYRRLMDLNYFGVLACIRATLPHLKERRGAIVAVSSVAGLRGFPTRTGYCASKFALNGFLEALRVELHRHGVWVSVVCPGVVETEIRAHALSEDGTEKRSELPTPGTPMSAVQCARIVVDAAQRRRRVVVPALVNKAVLALGRFAPSTLDRILIKRFG